MIMTSRPFTNRERRSSRPLASVTVTMREPPGPTAKVRVSFPTRCTFTSRPTAEALVLVVANEFAIAVLNDGAVAFLDDLAIAFAEFAALAAHVVQLAGAVVDRRACRRGVLPDGSLDGCLAGS